MTWVGLYTADLTTGMMHSQLAPSLAKTTKFEEESKLEVAFLSFKG
jgi:hypothetical protein